MSRFGKLSTDWLAHYSQLVDTWRQRPNGREDAEDAMHDTVVGMLESGVGVIDNPRAYMARGTSNGLISRYRRLNVIDFTPLQDLSEAQHPTTASADEGLRFQQLADALMDALEALPPKCRHVYIRHRLEGCSHTEIADEMGLSRSMVEKYMTRALRHIQQKLQRYVPY
ncbi:RNA polymerase sigma factor [Allopusillimonas ginsengisoli]|uniref:RNA polymerase sigma factor n=1 Tax=Allopusillimonas ginsengisoli TaxID=453575 RepID=UPI0010C20751|nr:sigma-70 family RNA polymerase sigma factor [Allopusillimonas ginsengisoli]